MVGFTAYRRCVYCLFQTRHHILRLPYDNGTLAHCRYAFSTYKVYGPHMAVLYGSDGAFRALLAARVPGPNHYFVPTDDFTYRWELGTYSYGIQRTCNFFQWTLIQFIAL